jgi:hypothetical protein
MRAKSDAFFYTVVERLFTVTRSGKGAQSRNFDRIIFLTSSEELRKYEKKKINVCCNTIICILALRVCVKILENKTAKLQISSLLSA